MSTYVISDIHSCFTKFVRNIPSDTKKLIIAGDQFNKGMEQVEQWDWMWKNKDNPKYIYLRGNCEVRLTNELIRHFKPNETNLYLKWLGTNTGYRNKNIANIVIELINRGRYKLDEVLDVLLNKFKWYHIEDNWIIAHAAWDVNKSPSSQNSLVLAYDIDNLLGKLRKKDSSVNIPKMYDNYNFIFGHTPIYNMSNQNIPPVIYHNKFYYIDNGMFKRARKIFFMKIK